MDLRKRVLSIHTVWIPQRKTMLKETFSDTVSYCMIHTVHHMIYRKYTFEEQERILQSGPHLFQSVLN